VAAVGGADGVDGLDGLDGLDGVDGIDGLPQVTARVNDWVMTSADFPLP
jgi:hypothetical protein